ncbi:hypothetical protein D3C75_1061270 [compost metagenome]
MVWATNHPLNSAGFLYQLDSAVAADVMEHLNLAFAVAHNQERQPHEIHRFDVRVRWQISSKTNACPVAAQDLVSVQFEERLLSVEVVGQAMGVFDGAEDSFKGLYRD